MENKKVQQSVAVFLDQYRDKHPEVFTNPVILASVKTILEDASNILVAAGGMVTTADIVKNVELIADRSVSSYDTKPLTEIEKEAFQINPTLFMKTVTISLWNVALDIIESVGYGGVDLSKTSNPVDLEGEYKFTSTEVGKA